MSINDLTLRHTVTAVGTPTEVSDGPFGQAAFAFGSGDGYEFSGNLADFGFPGAFTVEVMFRGTTPTDTLELLSSTVGVTGWELRSSSDDVYIQCRSSNGTSGAVLTVTSTGDLATGVWRTLALQRAPSGELSVYIDGTRVFGPSVIPEMPFADGQLLHSGTTNPFDLGAVRITKGASRYAGATYVPAAFPSGVDDPLWGSVVLLAAAVAPVSSGYTVTDITKTFVSGGVRQTYDGSSPRTVSGTLTAGLSAGEVLEVSVDGGATWATATVSSLTWSCTDTNEHTGSWTVKVRSKNLAGEYGTVVEVPVTYLTWPTVSITSMEKDDGVVGDWATSNGSAPRTVFGGLTRALTPDEVVLISFDGVNWSLATVSGLSWSAVDQQFHTTSWVIQAKVTNPPTGLSSPVASVSVTYVPPQPTVLPRGAYTTLLDIIRRFMERTGLPKPAFSIGNTDAQVAQILGLLEEATEELVMRNARGWQILNREAVFVTKAQEVQGSLSDLAPGFRVVINDTLFNRTTRLPIYGPLLPMERQATKALQTAGPYYRYWIANDQLHLYPTPPAGQTIAFEYTSTACWSDGQSPATYSEYPTTDTAICLFPKPVVIAQLRWRWKKEKGLEYAQDFDSAELLLNAAIAADGTRRVVDLGGTELVARPGIMIPTGSWPLK